MLDEFQFNDNIYIVLLHTGWSLVNDDDDMMYIVNSDTSVQANQVDTVASNQNAQISFLILPCLAPNALPSAPAARCVSFQPEYKPGYYLRHTSEFDMVYEKPPSDPSTDPTFNADASFIMRPNQWIEGSVAFQSVNYPDRYINTPFSEISRVLVILATFEGSTNAQDSSSFHVTARPDPWPIVDT